MLGLLLHPFIGSAAARPVAELTSGRLIIVKVGLLCPPSRTPRCCPASGSRPHPFAARWFAGAGFVGVGVTALRRRRRFCSGPTSPSYGRWLPPWIALSWWCASTSHCRAFSSDRGRGAGKIGSLLPHGAELHRAPGSCCGCYRARGRSFWSVEHCLACRFSFGRPSSLSRARFVVTLCAPAQRPPDRLALGTFPAQWRFALSSLADHRFLHGDTADVVIHGPVVAGRTSA